jgi:cytochrome c-type biogenesis protein CcmH
VRRLVRGFLAVALALGCGAALEAQTAPAQAPFDAPFDAARLAEIERTVGAPLGPPVEAAALESSTEEITGKLRCPVCQGLSVASSHTPTALAMKDQARQLVSLGFSERQILAVFEDSYGEFVRLEPKPQGFNLVVWIAPFLVLAAGLALVARRLIGGVGSVNDSTASAVAESGAPVAGDAHAIDPYLKKLREEIRRQ